MRCGPVCNLYQQATIIQEVQVGGGGGSSFVRCYSFPWEQQAVSVTREQMAAPHGAERITVFTEPSSVCALDSSWTPDPEDGGNALFWNVGKYLPVKTA
jgi:hypothetical protein